ARCGRGVRDGAPRHHPHRPRVERQSHRRDDMSAGGMRLFNTLTRREEPFAPVEGRTVRMYTCGLTVYARGHIGNFRTFVALDVLRRTLLHEAGFKVRQVMNFTDGDDRTILEAKKAAVPLREDTDRYIEPFKQDAAALG